MENERETEAERMLAEQLLEGDGQVPDPEEEAVKRLPPRWEIRIQTQKDPIAEETAVYRSMAKEVDGRYDQRAKPGSNAE